MRAPSLAGKASLSKMKVYETCVCGAELEAQGLHVSVAHEADKFRAAHAICRSRLKSVKRG